MSLGQRILNDLDPSDQSGTLERWMAHRVAELIERAEQAPDVTTRESARRECSDLIIRLWDHRASRRYGRPLSHITSFLEQLSNADSTPARAMTQTPEETWIGLMQRLDALNDCERQICFDASVTDLDVEQERAWLEEHGDDLSDDERRIITSVLVRHDGTRSEYYRLDGTPIPNFAGLSANERFKQGVEALERIDGERKVLLDVFRIGHLAAASEPVPDSDTEG